jgi:hypothetical protein
VTVPKLLEIVGSPPAILDQDQNFRPEYIRLPKPYERCRLTGLSRSTLAELVVPCDANGHKPPVKSLVVRKRGATRGIRLINYDSLLDYLRKLEGESASPNGEAVNST